MVADRYAPGSAARSPRTGAPDAAWTPPLFFDAAGGLPPSPTTRHYLAGAWESAWADPAGRHAWATRSAAVLGESRARFADFLGCLPEEVWFGENPDAALATAVDAMVCGLPGGESPAVVVGPLERLAVLRACDAWAGVAQQTLLAVDGRGRIEPNAIPPAGGKPRILIAQAANREIGTTQDIPALADAAGPGASLLVDASAVRRRADVPQRWDVVVLDPTMWGGPSGVSVMACRTTAPWGPRPPASPSDRFPGRPCVPLVAAAAMSLPDGESLEAAERHAAKLAAGFAHTVARMVPLTALLGSPDHRLGHIVSLSLPYVNADQLLDDLGRRGFAAASGSACTADTRRPSHVLTAIGAMTHGNLRVSLPPGCPQTDVDRLAQSLQELVAAQRSEAGLS